MDKERTRKDYYESGSGHLAHLDITKANTIGDYIEDHKGQIYVAANHSHNPNLPPTHFVKGEKVASQKS